VEDVFSFARQTVETHAVYPAHGDNDKPTLVYSLTKAPLMSYDDFKAARCHIVYYNIIIRMASKFPKLKLVLAAHGSRVGIHLFSRIWGKSNIES